MIETDLLWWLFAIWVPTVVPSLLLLFSMRNVDRKVEGGRTPIGEMGEVEERNSTDSFLSSEGRGSGEEGSMQEAASEVSIRKNSFLGKVFKDNASLLTGHLLLFFYFDNLSQGGMLHKALLRNEFGDDSNDYAEKGWLNGKERAHSITF